MMPAVPLNWFDMVALIVLAVGVWRGKKRGMSEELLDAVQWLAIVVVSALLYQPIGKFVSGYTPLSLLLSYISSYIFVAIVIKLLFGLIRRGIGEKLVGSDVFGRSEYYLGMVAGGVRFACFLLLGLALLGAKSISPEELAADARMQKDNFGDISFPTLGSIQQDVLVRSLTGRFVRNTLPDQLIEPTPSGKKVAQPETIGRRKERLMDEVLGTRK